MSAPIRPVAPLAPQGPSRRTVVGALAWSAPVVLVTQSSPAFAVSPPCEPVEDFFRWTVGVQFTGLHRDHPTYANGSWNAGSSLGTFSFRGGFVAADSSNVLAAVQYTSSTGAYTIQGVNEEFQVSPGYALTWNALPSGWSVTPTAGPAGTTYLFRKDDRATVKTTVTATPAGVAVTSGAPGSLIPATPIFTAILSPSQFTQGDAVLTSRSHGVLTRVQRTIAHATQSSCNAAIALWSAAQTLTVTPVQNPSSAAMAARRAAVPAGATGGATGV